MVGPEDAEETLYRVVTRLLRAALERLVPEGWYVDSQEPVTLTHSEPEPDVMVVRGDTRQYLDRHPGPQDLALVVEVSDTTVERDRTVKKRLYAAAGVGTYWIVNLPERQIEVYADPQGPGEAAEYRQRRAYSVSDTVPVVLDGVKAGGVDVGEILRP